MAANLQTTTEGKTVCLVLAAVAYVEAVGDVATGKTLVKFKDSEDRNDLMIDDDYTTVQAAIAAA